MNRERRRVGLDQRRLRLMGCALGAFGFALVQAAPAAGGRLTETFERIFRPFETDQVALSPSGRYVAYTRRQKDNLILTVRDFEANTVRKLVVGVDQAAPFSDVEATPARLTFLRWAARDRLVFNLDGVNVWSIGADFSDRKLLANGNTFDRGPGGPPPVISNSDDVSSEQVSAKAVAKALPGTDAARLYAAPHFLPIDVVSLPRGAALAVLASFGTGAAQGKRLTLVADAVTGAVRKLPDTDSSTSMIFDRQGEPRLSRDYHSNTYRYRPPGGGWTPMAPSIGASGHPSSDAGAANDARQFGSAIGFGPNPNVLYFHGRTAGGLGVFAVDPRTWQRTGFEFALPNERLASEEPLLFDDSTGHLVGVRLTTPDLRVVWVDPDFKSNQDALDATLPKRRWKILEWNYDSDVFLTFQDDASDPGKYCLFRPADSEIVEFLDIAPWLTDDDKNETVPFSCTTREGIEITGLLTRPRHPRLKVPPLVVWCGEQRLAELASGYQREAQAFATMGFSVLQLNPRLPARGSGGAAGNLDSSDQMLLEAIVSALEALPASVADRRLTAIAGRDYGGYLALRAMELYPDRFRCGIAVDAPTDLYALCHPARTLPLSLPMKSIAMSRGSDASPSQAGERSFIAGPLTMSRIPSPSTAPRVRREFAALSDDALRECSPATHPERIQSPIMIAEADGNAVFGGNAFAAAVRQRVPDTVFLPLTAEKAARLPHAQALLFDQMADFLTAYIYNYAVKIGALQVVDDAAAPPLKPAAPAVQPEAPLPKFEPEPPKAPGLPLPVR